MQYKKSSGDFEIRVNEIEEKIKELMQVINDKEITIKNLETSIRDCGNDNLKTISKIKTEKEKIIADKNNEVE